MSKEPFQLIIPTVGTQVLYKGALCVISEVVAANTVPLNFKRGPISKKEISPRDHLSYVIAEPEKKEFWPEVARLSWVGQKRRLGPGHSQLYPERLNKVK